VVVGAADGPLGNLGTGAISPGVAGLSLGMSGAVRTVVPEPQVDDRHTQFCYALTESAWVVGGAISNGGLVVRWAGHALAPDLLGQSVEQHHDEWPDGIVLGEVGSTGNYQHHHTQAPRQSADVKARIDNSFKRMSTVGASRVTVEASGGEVTLHGSVRSWGERHEAEIAAYGAPGVWIVHNYLRVRES
jgi:hypothetical protein